MIIKRGKIEILNVFEDSKYGDSDSDNAKIEEIKKKLAAMEKEAEEAKTKPN